MSTAVYGPGVTLRIGHVEVHHDFYDGAVRLGSQAAVIAPDGMPNGHHVACSTRFAPNEWHGLTFPAMIRRHVRHHYAQQGLEPPADELLPYHLHPQGFPGLEQWHPLPDAPEPEPYDPLALRDALVSLKQDELRATAAPGYRPTLNPAAHPLAPRTPTPEPRDSAPAPVDVAPVPLPPHRRPAATATQGDESWQAATF